MHFLITAGPTREPIDPVRFLSNRSSGKMGYAVAAAARSAGHEVTLVSGPVALPCPPGVHRIPVTTAQEMHTAVHAALPRADVAVLAAAVADYRPVQAAPHKIKKDQSGSILTLTLERTPDILGSLRPAGFRGVLMGFAAETDDLERNALAKLRAKGCDAVAANDVSGAATGFDSSENEITLLLADGTRRLLPRASKEALAEILVGVCAELMVR